MDSKRLLLIHGIPVARGRICEGDMIHCSKLPIRTCKVSIDEVLEPECMLPYPTAEMSLVGDALKSFVTWPLQEMKEDVNVQVCVTVYNYHIFYGLSVLFPCCVHVMEFLVIA